MKIIRKYVAIIMTVLMLICSKPVYAQEPMFGSSTIEYTVDDSFMVHVPETLTIDTEAYIYGDQINIDPAKSVYVHISGTESSTSISFTPYIDSYDQTQKAGKYTCVVYFDIFCE